MERTSGIVKSIRTWTDVSVLVQKYEKNRSASSKCSQCGCHEQTLQNAHENCHWDSGTNHQRQKHEEHGNNSAQTCHSRTGHKFYTGALVRNKMRWGVCYENAGNIVQYVHHVHFLLYIQRNLSGIRTSCCTCTAKKYKIQALDLYLHFVCVQNSFMKWRMETAEFQWWVLQGLLDHPIRGMTTMPHSEVLSFHCVSVPALIIHLCPSIYFNTKWTSYPWRLDVLSRRLSSPWNVKLYQLVCTTHHLVLVDD